MHVIYILTSSQISALTWSPHGIPTTARSKFGIRDSYSLLYHSLEILVVGNKMKKMREIR